MEQSGIQVRRSRRTPLIEQTRQHSFPEKKPRSDIRGLGQPAVRIIAMNNAMNNNYVQSTLVYKKLA